MTRNLNDLPCNPASSVEPTSSRARLHKLAQDVWAEGEDKLNMGYDRGVAFEAELKERLEALLCTLDRYNDL